MPITFTLLLVLHAGTAKERVVQVAERLEWADCVARAMHELSRRVDPVAAVCEPMVGERS